MSNSKRLYSLAEASRKLNHGRNYVCAWTNNHKDELPEWLIIGDGKSKLISDDGIEWIKSHVKKEGVPVSNRSADEDKHLKPQFLGETLQYFIIQLCMTIY